MLLRPDSGGRQGVITRRKRNAIESTNRGVRGGYPTGKGSTNAVKDAVFMYPSDYLRSATGYIGNTIDIAAGAVNPGGWLDRINGRTSIVQGGGGNTGHYVPGFSGDTRNIDNALLRETINRAPIPSDVRERNREEFTSDPTWSSGINPAAGILGGVAGGTFTGMGARALTRGVKASVPAAVKGAQLIEEAAPTFKGAIEVAARRLGSEGFNATSTGIKQVPMPASAARRANARKNPTLRDVVEANPPEAPKGNEANLAKLGRLAEEGTIPQSAYEMFAESSGIMPNLQAVLDIAEKASVEGRPLLDLPVIRQGRARPKGEPSIQRVQVSKATVKDGVEQPPEFRVGVFGSEGDVGSLLGTAMGAQFIPGYRGGTFLGGQNVTTLITKPEVAKVVGGNYATVARNMLMGVDPKIQGPAATEFYPAASDINKGIAAKYSDRALPNGNPITPEYSADIGAMLSSGTKPELQFAQQDAVISLIASKGSPVYVQFGRAVKALDTLRAKEFKSVKEAETALRAFKAQYVEGDNSVAAKINEILKQQKLGGQRTSGNIKSIVSAGATVVRDRSTGAYRIVGEHGKPRFEVYTPEGASKTVTYGAASVDADRPMILGHSQFTQDVWDQNFANTIAYQPQTGIKYKAMAEEATRSLTENRKAFIKFLMDRGISEEEAIRRADGPSHMQGFLWDFGRSHAAPTLVEPVVRYK